MTQSQKQLKKINDNHFCLLTLEPIRSSFHRLSSDDVILNSYNYGSLYMDKFNDVSTAKIYTLFFILRLQQFA